jgi:hypothetical protein
MERFASPVNPYPENTNDHCTYYLHARVSNRHPLDRQPARYPLNKRQRHKIDIVIGLLEAVIVACVASTIATLLTLHFS